VTPFDINTATPAEVLLEARRRSERAARGLPLNETANRNGAPPGVAHFVPAEVVRVVLPWSFLCSDNDKDRAGIRGRRAVKLLTDAYKDAKKKAHEEAVKQMPHAALAGPVSLVATLYPPNRSRTRDATNYCKMVHDALEGACYRNDGQIVRATWQFGAPDVDRPRVEIVITPEALP
jgi:Holliday junction resolvase RusA-like endonuclease